MRSPIVLCIFVGLAYATNPGWKDTNEYVYKVLGKSLANIDETSNQYSGIFLRANLRVQPKSDGKLLAVIIDPQYSQVNSQLPEGWKNQISDSELTWKPLELSSKPFEIYMKDGLVVDLVVNKDLQNWEANIIKGIVSQFQMNTKGKHLINTESGFNSLPKPEDNSGVFMCLEDTVTGNTRIMYQIKPLPSHILQDKYTTLRIARNLREDEQVIEVMKHKNYNESVELPSYSYGFRGMGEQFNENVAGNKMGDYFVRDATSWAILTGDLSRYTIQHSMTVNKIFIKPTFGDKKLGSVVSVMNVTLEELRTQDESIQEVSEPVHLGNLVYTYEKPFSPSNKVYSKKPYQAQYPWEMDPAQTYQIQTNMGRPRRSVEERDDEYFTNSEESYKQDHPNMNEAPASPLLPFTDGFYGMSIKSKVNIVEEVQKLTREIGVELVDQTKTNDHEDVLERFTTLCSLIRLMNAEELQNAARALYSNAEEGTTRSTWTVFRDAVAQSGTGPAFFTIQNWVETKKIRDEEASQVVSTMTNAVRQPTIYYMKYYFGFIHKSEVLKEYPLNDTALLGYTELIRRVYTDESYSKTHYPVKSFVPFRTKEGIEFVREDVIPYLTEKLNEAISEASTQKIHVYIRALGNIADPHILSAFEPYLEGRKQASQFQRLLMILSIDKLSEYYPKEARTVMFKVYQNSGESQEVRIAAVYQLMRCSPTAEMLQVMASNTNTEVDDHVNAAVKSSIESAAELDWPYSSLRDAARAAKPLLTPRVFGLHEGANFLRSFVNEEWATSFKQSAQSIGEEDGRSFLKGFRYSLRSRMNGMERRWFNIQSYVSSVEELLHVGAKQWDSYQEQEKQQRQHADEQQKYPWSSQYIANLLNMKSSEREQLEGYLNSELGELYRMFSFDNRTIEQLPRVIREIEEELKQGKKINFQKLFNGEEIALSFPTEIGLPFLYTYDNPILVSFQGKLSAESTPRLSQNEKIYKPDIILMDGDVEIVLSSKAQSRVSFTAPFEHQQYVAGFDKHAELHLPLRTKVELDFANDQLKIEFLTEKVLRDTRAFQYSTKPYTSIVDLKNFEPISSRANTKYIKPEFITRTDKIYGKNSFGLAFHVITEQNRMFVDSELPQILNGKVGIYGAIRSIWDDADIQYRHMEVTFLPKQSSTRNIVFHVGTQKTYKSEAAPETTGKWKFDEDASTVERQHSLIDKVSEGINNSKSQSICIYLKFLGEKNINYYLVGAYGKSNVDPKSRAMAYWKMTSDDQDSKNYEGHFISKSHIPNTNGLDLTYSLQEEPLAETEMEISFGPIQERPYSIEATLKQWRSDDRKQYLKNLPMYHKCQEQMRKGNKQLPACLNMTLSANLLNRVSMKVKYDFESKVMDTLKIKDYEFALNYLPSFEALKPTPSLADNEFMLQGYFYPDLKYVNVTFETHNNGMKIRNIPVSELTKQMFVAHPVFHVKDRLFALATGSQTYRPACVVDQTETNTFSNYSYPVAMSKHWTVLFHYLPKEARHQERTIAEQLRSQLINHVVLMRQNPESPRHRDVKITLSAPETHYKIVDIEMSPNPSRSPSEPMAKVTVNGKQVKISAKSSHDIDGGYVQIYALPNGEVKVEVSNGFYVLYDGERARLNPTSGQYRGATRGLCGQFNDQKSEEFLTSEDCYARDSKKFVKSFEMEGQDGHKIRKVYSVEGRDCVVKRVPLYADVIGDAEAHRQESAGGSQQGKCTHFKTRYVHENGDVCFTLRPLPACGSHCSPTGFVSKDVPVHCIQKSNVAQLWKDQIDKGASPDFSMKKTHKTISLSVPHSCSE